MSTENDPFRTWRGFGRELQLLREAIRAHLLSRVLVHRAALELQLGLARRRCDAAEARAHADAGTHRAASQAAAECTGSGPLTEHRDEEGRTITACCDRTCAWCQARLELDEDGAFLVLAPRLPEQHAESCGCPRECSDGRVECACLPECAFCPLAANPPTAGLEPDETNGARAAKAV